MKHILIDYENVQPTQFDDIATAGCCVWLFLGINQQKSLPLSLVEFLLTCERSQVRIIKMQHAGKNALDFYLSFYLGRIATLEPNASIQIISRDTGYDVLVEHLKQDYPNISIMRTGVEALALSGTVSPLKPKTKKTQKKNKKKSKAKKSATQESFKPLYQQAIVRLKRQVHKGRPSKRKTLENFLRSQLNIDDTKLIKKIITKMASKEVIDILENNRVVYNHVTA